MKFTLSIQKISTVNQIESYWSIEDYIKLLELYDFGEADSNDLNEVRDLLFMAITDFDPAEAAAILLSYKLEDRLSSGQIDQLSYEMINDKVAEEYPDISLHSRLFHINQLLYKAFNGVFPNIKASIIELTIEAKESFDQAAISPARFLRLLAPGLSDHSLLKRLFHDQLEAKADFPEAQSIIWELHPLGHNAYKLITSDYWLNEEDFAEDTFVGELSQLMDEEEDK